MNLALFKGMGVSVTDTDISVRQINSRWLAYLLACCLISCSSRQEDKDLQTTCTPAVGEGCTIHSQKGDVFWDLSKIKEGEEYVIIFHSQANTEAFDEFQHSLFIQSSVASAPLSPQEKRFRDKIAEHLKEKNPTFSAPVDHSILPPRPSFQGPALNVDPFRPFYIPEPNDYISRFAEKTVPFYLRSVSSQPLSGRTISFELFPQNSSSFHLYVNPQAGLSAETLTRLSSCLSQIIPQTLAFLGPLLDQDGDSAIKVLVSPFEGRMGGNTLGFFSSIDRFKTYGGSPLPDSNHGEIIYLSSAFMNEPSRACSTTAHELQHLINFDAKVLSQLSSQERNDMKASENIRPEHLSLDEAYAHVAEELSEEEQKVSEHIYNFLTNPNQTSFALETAWDNLYSNSRTRGLATLFLYYVIRKSGGTLNANDPSTQNTLNKLIQSPRSGFQNVAQFLGMTEQKLLEDFFTKITLWIFQRETTFVPSLEKSEQLNKTRGIELMNATAPLQEIPFRPPIVHPYQINIPLLSRSENHSLPGQGIAFFRLIVPSEKPPKVHVILSTKGTIAFSAYLVRIK